MSLCILVLLASCKEEDFFSFTGSTPDEISFASDGGSSTLSFSTSTAWKAGSDVDWIRLTPSSGNAEQGQITVTADPNPGLSTRSGKISIFAGAIVNHLIISQNENKGAVTERPGYEIGPAEQELEIKVQANIDYKVEVLGNATEWVTIVSAPDTKALTESKIVFKIAENSSFDKRSATVRIYGGGTENSFEIVQSPPVFIDMVEELTIPYVGDYHNTDVSYDLELTTNTSITAKIQDTNCKWLTVKKVSRIEELPGGIKKYSVRLEAEKNYEWDRETELSIKTGEESHTVVIKQDGIKPILMGLVDSATGGSRQALKRTWGTDEPISNWAGIRIFNIEEQGESIEIWPNMIDIEGSLPPSFGKLRNLHSLLLAGKYSGTIPAEWGEMRCYTLRLISPNITGPIPPELGNIENLEDLDIHGEPNINSPLPAELGKLKKLRYLRMGNCSITGAIPSTFGDLENLEVLELNDNKLSGGIPASLGKLKKIQKIDLLANQLTGPVPEDVLKADWWKNNIELIVSQAGYTIIPPKPYAQIRDITYPDIYNISHSTHELAKKNKYTILLRYSTTCYWSTVFMPVILKLFEKYHDKGLGVITLAYLGTDYFESIPEYIVKNGMSALTNLVVPSNWNYDLGRVGFYSGDGWLTPGIFVVDNDFNILYGEGEDRNTLEALIEKLLGKVEEGGDTYTSTDYSKDGEVLHLQNASVGNGIKLVLMGDGFVDKDMVSGGKYEERMIQAMEAFFSEEPAKSLRDRFDVYTVKAVSGNEGIGEGRKTAFSTYFGDGSYIGGDNERCFEYALKVPGIDNHNDLSILTVLNSEKYAGTCYVYSNGASVAYCPYISNNEESFNQVVHHESVGHGFGRLADEYVNDKNATIPGGRLNELLLWQSYGYYQNVDVTDNPAGILWSGLLNNSDYAGQVGIYEGGYGYGKGVWRPTVNSIMNQNEGGFNAPSRREIYKRAIELSGESFTEENFLEFDKRFIQSGGSRTQNRSARLNADFVPFAPPVLIR